MINLAGCLECDGYIAQELTEAGIPIVSEDCTESEVPAHFTGQLAKFHFKRAWYYWVVSGPVPLEVARALYQTALGKKDVRVVGHCGCPPPDKWVTWFDQEGRRLVDAEEEKLFDRFVEIGIIPAEEKSQYHFTNPVEFSKLGKGVIESYHIDSQAGLNLFVKTLREAGVV